MKRPLAALLLLLVLPFAGAAEPEDAPALWQEQVGDDGVLAVAMGAPVRAGEPIQASIRFQADYPVVDVQYQICEVGQACFAIGIPTEPDGEGSWHLNTLDLTLHRGPAVRTIFGAGERIGIQFFVFLEGMEEGEFLLFPEGLPDDHPWVGRNATEEEFVAWSETHYFAVTIQEGDAAQPTPGPGILAVLALLGTAAAVATRARRSGGQGGADASPNDFPGRR